MTATERFALDTNLLAYSRDDLTPAKQARAREVIERAIRCGRCVLSVQVVGELYASLRKRATVPPEVATQAVREMTSLFPLIGIDPGDTEQALRTASWQELSYWDALMVATVGRAGCTTLLSEDMGDGRAHHGVTVRNPFVGDRVPAEIEALFG